MSILFTPLALGTMEIHNRFVCSACEDNLADDAGLVTDATIRKYQILARGEVGLIISSHLSVHPWGLTRKNQLGIYDDQMIPGLHRLVEAVHGESGKIVFQLGHAGLNAKNPVLGRPPLGPSGSENEMDEDTLQETINAFGRAAERAAVAGADGVQLHAAHGYLINEFLSPFFNHRQDAWGGSEDHCFRLLKEIVLKIKKVLPAGRVLLVKLNTHDYTPEEGITPSLSVHYARRLAEMSIDGLEVSCGTSAHSPWNMCRGDVPVQEILQNIPAAKRPHVEESLNRIRHRFSPVEGYNRDKAIAIRPVMGHVPLFAVGGWRRVEAMEEAVAKGETDFIAMCRPFIREPDLVRKIRKGKTAQASCISCNRCLIALANDRPARCYHKGGP